MDEFFIDLIKRYENKVWDDNFINEVIYYFKYEKGLTAYIKYDQIKNTKEIFPMSYQYDTHELFKNDKAINKVIDNAKIENKSNMFINIYIIQMILHELEHANQKKIIETDSTGFEADLLRISKALKYLEYQDQYIHNENYNPKWFKQQRFKDFELYKANKQCNKLVDAKEYFSKKFHSKITNSDFSGYYVIPQERLAQSKSIDNVLSLIIHMEMDQDIIDFFNAKKDECLIDPYKLRYWGLISPTVKFLKKAKLINEIKESDWYDRNNNKCLNKCQNMFSLEERILYGLPISKEEHKQLLKI